MTDARPPRNPREELLCRLFAEVLDVPEVGADDSFFDLGGDSIVSMRLVSRAREAGLEFGRRDVFTHPSVAALAAVARDLAAPEPEAEGPQTAEPQTGEPATVESETAESETAEPGNAAPERTGSGHAAPEPAEAERGEAERGEAERGEAERADPDRAEPRSARPESGKRPLVELTQDELDDIERQISQM